jgi:hypothetical protein
MMIPAIPETDDMAVAHSFPATMHSPLSPLSDPSFPVVPSGLNHVSLKYVLKLALSTKAFTFSSSYIKSSSKKKVSDENEVPTFNVCFHKVLLE